MRYRGQMQKKFDEIRIEDLEVFANHGVFPEENTLGQKFVVSAVLLQIPGWREKQMI